jgi:hypothetical protein
VGGFANMSTHTTVKEAILKSLGDLKKPCTSNEVYEHIIKEKYYVFGNSKTPAITVSTRIGEFIRSNDTRVKRIKGNGNCYLYYLAEYEQEINIDDISEQTLTPQDVDYQERDLHKLLSTYLKSKNIFTKTIFHEKSKNSRDKNQKWIHPDIIGVEFLNLTSETCKTFMNVLQKSDTLKLISYEIKREIKTDYELKEYYFQAVSNSSWANYGYLVALEIGDNLKNEMERLNQSFGIGIIELSANPYESKILFQAKLKELDFKTIDKLCNVNKDYRYFIEVIEKLLTAESKYYQSTKKELVDCCDSYLISDSEVEKYCKEKHIPFEENK